MLGLLVGRFQPFHLGHLEVVRHLLDAEPGTRLLLAVGSAQESYTEANPLTAGERLEMIARALPAEAAARVQAIPVVDVNRHALWVAHLQELLPAFEVVYTNNPLTRLLFERARVRVEAPPLYDRARLSGTAIRAAILAGAPWQDRVPAPVARYLESVGLADRLRRIREARP